MLVNSWYWDGTLADRELAYSQSTKAVNFLRDITPDSAAYIVRQMFIVTSLNTNRILE